MYKVLIVDDDVAVTNYLMVFLAQTEEYESTVVNESRDVQEVLRRESFDVLLVDMDMPLVSGMDILKLVRDDEITTPVVILTGVGDVDLAVNAMKLGAFDYLSKPVEEEHLLDVLANAIEHKSTQHSIRSLPGELVREDLSNEGAFDQFPTLDPDMIRLLHEVEKMAASDLPIFIWGERGTTKELLAHAIHNTSSRRNGPFVEIDCEAISPEKFPADFFGQVQDWSGTHDERPGFLESAEGGTLFIENIDCLSFPMQMRLKRFIKSNEFYREKSTTIKKVDVRLIAASQHDPLSEKNAEGFSKDLLYHLMVNSIRIPSLRERVNDIPLLAEHFLKMISVRTGKAISGFEPEYLELLKRYDFPYNRMELLNIIEASVISSDEGKLTVDSIPSYVRKKVDAGAKIESDLEPKNLNEIE